MIKKSGALKRIESTKSNQFQFNSQRIRDVRYMFVINLCWQPGVRNGNNIEPGRKTSQTTLKHQQLGSSYHPAIMLKFKTMLGKKMFFFRFVKKLIKSIIKDLEAKIFFHHRWMIINSQNFPC